jgi:hypothetical protein
MAITRVQIETVLVRRLENWLTAADMAVTIVGTNADLNDPITNALLQLEIVPANISSVADSDLTSVATTDYNKLLDLAELRTLESILENYSKVDVEAGAVKAQLDDFGQRIERTIQRKREQIARRYGLEGLASLEAGVINLGFQQEHVI